MDTLKREVSWPVVVASIGAFVVVVWFVMSPRDHYATTARRAACMNNLRQIGLAIKQYAYDNGGRFPDSLGELLKGDYITTTKVFICLSTRTKIPASFPTDFKAADLADLKTIDGITDYIYLRGLDGNAPPDFVLMFDRAPNHDGDGRNVLFVDGHVKWYAEEDFLDLMEEQRERVDRMRAEKTSGVQPGKE